MRTEAHVKEMAHSLEHGVFHRMPALEDLYHSAALAAGDDFNIVALRDARYAWYAFIERIYTLKTTPRRV